MSVADKIRESLSRSSWIRKMFEEGDRLRQLHKTILNPGDEVIASAPSFVEYGF